MVKWVFLVPASSWTHFRVDSSFLFEIHARNLLNHTEEQGLWPVNFSQKENRWNFSRIFLLQIESARSLIVFWIPPLRGARAHEGCASSNKKQRRCRTTFPSLMLDFQHQTKAWCSGRRRLQLGCARTAQAVRSVPGIRRRTDSQEELRLSIKSRANETARDTPRRTLQEEREWDTEQLLLPRRIPTRAARENPHTCVTLFLWKFGWRSASFRSEEVKLQTSSRRKEVWGSWGVGPGEHGCGIQRAAHLVPFTLDPRRRFTRSAAARLTGGAAVPSWGGCASFARVCARGTCFVAPGSKLSALSSGAAASWYTED